MPVEPATITGMLWRVFLPVRKSAQRNLPLAARADQDG